LHIVAGLDFRLVHIELGGILVGLLLAPRCRHRRR
jgi:hypothetical protein